jgi:uncharacterized DUF497 family protein
MRRRLRPIFAHAVSIFGDPRNFTLADTTHSESEERWFSIGLANNGGPLTVGSRRSTATEIRAYTENQ